MPFLALSDQQMSAVMSAAADLEQEKRSLFLQRLSSLINLKGRRFSDTDFDEMIKLASEGLIHRSSAA